MNKNKVKTSRRVWLWGAAILALVMLGAFHLRDAYEALWNEVLDDAIAADLVTGDRALVSRFVLGALNWTVRWYDPDGPRDPEQLAHELVVMITRRP